MKLSITRAKYTKQSKQTVSKQSRGSNNHAPPFKEVPMISSNMETEVLEDIKIDEKIIKQVLEPGKYNVIFVNDNETPMEWVVEVLTKVFHHSEKSAQDIMLIVHEKGAAVVGTYSYEIAEQKAIEANSASRAKGFPLVVKVEAE